MSRPKGAFIISVGRGFVLPVAALIILAFATGGGGIWWSQLIGELVCIIISVALLKTESKHFGKLKLITHKD